jgi:anti-sigma factor (TIGR02949 family)
MNNGRQDADTPPACGEVLARLYEYLDDELPSNVDEQVRAHVAECPTCRAHSDYERVFLRFLARHAQLVRVPATLRQRILRALLDQEVARQRS